MFRIPLCFGAVAILSRSHVTNNEGNSFAKEHYFEALFLWIYVYFFNEVSFLDKIKIRRLVYVKNADAWAKSRYILRILNLNYFSSSRNFIVTYHHTWIDSLAHIIIMIWFFSYYWICLSQVCNNLEGKRFLSSLLLTVESMLYSSRFHQRLEHHVHILYIFTEYMILLSTSNTLWKSKQLI